jgi:hypothetical protein
MAILIWSLSAGASPADDQTALASQTASVSGAAIISPATVGPAGNVGTEATGGAARDTSAPVAACRAKTAKKSQRPATCRPKGPGKGAATGPTNIPGAIAESLAKMATQQLAGFVLSQAGLDQLLDPNTKRFEALQARLDGISDQIATLQSSVGRISSELAAIQLNQFAIELGRYVTDVQQYYNRDYKPMMAELEKYVEAAHDAVEAGLDCDHSDACRNARDKFETNKTEFLQNAPSRLSDNSHLHTSLVPDNTGRSALKAYGEYLMRGDGSTGFLTTADSDRLLNFYRYFAEYRALATWMKAEYEAHRFLGQPKPEDRQPDHFAEFVEDEIIGYQAKEQAGLPARIPRGAVISLPVLVEQRTTTLNRPMWIWDWTVEAGLTWNPSNPATQTRSVPAALTTLNTTGAGGGFRDWHVPSRADLAGLVTGQSARFANDNLQEFLDRILPNDGFEQQLRLGNLADKYLWTSDAAGTKGDATCALSSSDRVTVGGYANTGMFVGNKLTADPSSFPLEYIPTLVMPLTLQPVTISPSEGTTRDQRIQSCKDELARRVTAAIETGADYLYHKRAHLIATRSTGNQPFMP